MTNHQLNTDRDTVLYAFQDACDRPTPAQILDWTKRFPQFADDIIETANLLLELQPDREEPVQEASDSLLRRVQSDALSAVFEAEQAASGDGDSAAMDFATLVTSRATTVPALAREIEIDRVVLGELIAGRLLGRAGSVLLRALAWALQVSIPRLEQAIARASPSLGLAKASGPPKALSRRYEDIINASMVMTDDQKRYWLGEASTWTPGKTFD